MSRLEMWQVKQRQNLPLSIKEKYTEARIKEWYEYHNGNVYVAFSGGKDSLVLLHQVRKLYPLVPAVFSDTGLEFSVIREFVKSFDNVVWLKPKKTFVQVLEQYGYPVVSKEVSQKISEIRNTKSCKLRDKRLFGDEKGNGKLSEKWKYLIQAPFKISSHCCSVLKKQPMISYQSKNKRFPYIGTLACDSSLRLQTYLKYGCNLFINTKTQKSTPMAFWKTEDIWEYIKKYGLKYCPIYDEGWKNTGCTFCMFGINYEESPNRFQRLKNYNYKLYDYCINALNLKQCLDFMEIPY